MIGERGQTPKLQMKAAISSFYNKFERGQEDVFSVSLPNDLGKLTKIVIGHDNSGVG